MIRRAILAELKKIDDLAIRAITKMKKDNINQWDENYPRQEHFAKDIEHGGLFVYEENSEILGVMALYKEIEDSYQTIKGWKTPHGESMVIHRVIVNPNYERKGIFQQLFQFAKEKAIQSGYKSIKIDTHKNNYKMRAFLEKNGFQYIGHLDVIDREAYEYII
jgi:GNAT superfamily N-acetyltransferase